MRLFPTVDYTPPDRAILTRLADGIVSRGLAVPAILFLEMNKPLAFLGSQALVFFGPIITAFIRSEPYYQAAELLEDRRNVEFLLQEIERMERERSGDESKSTSGKEGA